MLNLISIVPKWIGGTSLSTVVLKSYLLSRLPGLSIKRHTFFSNEEADSIAARIVAAGCPVTGFSVYMWNLKTVLNVCSLIKKKDPHSFIILGGPTASFDADNILRDNPAVDLIVRGEGEIPLFHVMSAMQAGEPDFSRIPNLIFRKNGSMIKTPFVPSQLVLEEQSYPLDIESFRGLQVVYAETSRGCVFECAYCAWNISRSGVRGFRYYPINKVLQELEALFALPELEMLLFTDSNLMLGKERTLAILSAVNRLNQERRIKGLHLIKVNFEFNPEHLDEELLPEIKKLYVENYPIGLQSVEKEVLLQARRRFDKEKYLKNIRRLKEKTGAAILVEVIFGLPKDSYGGFRRTLEFLVSELQAELFVCYRYSVLPGSTFWEKKEEYNLRHQEEAPYLIISSDTFSEEDLNRAEALAYYLQIIYRVFRSIKKYIDNNIRWQKLPVYEEISEMLARNHGDFLKPKLVYDDGFLEDVVRLRSPENRAVRQKMATEARRIVKKYISAGMDQGEQVKSPISN